VPRYLLPITHRPERDGAPVTMAHVPFFLALEVASDAWSRAVRELCAPALSMSDLAVVHVESDFRREMFTGELTVDVAVQEIGRASITVRAELTQDGSSTGAVTFVFARVDAGRLGSVPLAPDQRRVLEALLPAAAEQR
jgi:acyl-CoA thioesterase FadM